ncbi:peptide/nickel transport system permease protein [Acetitomaculum ruminis DSM 5522]|uniref:Peptide/nickel transport system permease protein n=1 Tax=Acetitomaculum ruminis DSM 5522 TaxID=1120918 RepID=A0A1I0ZKN4_9FIRM|nr:ABC transporter permease [Acetitomaculum ruminis]SFB26214.1 peptide/nickel transport system permease protein [Acetitomaculum ruminis DSM 5522]
MKVVLKYKRLFKKILKRIGTFLVAMFLLSVISFGLARLAPGDPLQSFYGDQLDTMTDEEKEMARERLGLGDNVVVQYVKWINNAAKGNFGISFKYKMPVTKVVNPLIGNSLLLGITAYVVIFLLATVLAVFCVLHEEHFIDRLICKIGTILYYTPGFWLGVVLVLIFSINLGLFPSSGAYDVGKANDIANRISHMILPLTVMIASHLWYYAYMIRNKLLDEVRKDYVLLAKVKGCSKREIVWKHCLRNVAPTIVSIMAISIPHVTGGTVVVESVFNYPGIGGLAVESAKYHDYNLLIVIVLITGAAVFAAGLIAQSINEEIDPRMKERSAIKW